MTAQENVVAAEDTIWVEQVSWIDRIPRSVSMLAVLAVFLGLWELVTWTARINLPADPAVGRPRDF